VASSSASTNRDRLRRFGAAPVRAMVGDKVFTD
jgi:hypothetical protein